MIDDTVKAMRVLYAEVIMYYMPSDKEADSLLGPFFGASEDNPQPFRTILFSTFKEEELLQKQNDMSRLNEELTKTIETRGGKIKKDKPAAKSSSDGRAKQPAVLAEEVVDVDVKEVDSRGREDFCAVFVGKEKPVPTMEDLENGSPSGVHPEWHNIQEYNPYMHGLCGNTGYTIHEHENMNAAPMTAEERFICAQRLICDPTDDKIEYLLPKEKAAEDEAWSFEQVKLVQGDGHTTEKKLRDGHPLTVWDAKLTIRNTWQKAAKMSHETEQAKYAVKSKQTWKREPEPAKTEPVAKPRQSKVYEQAQHRARSVAQALLMICSDWSQFQRLTLEEGKVAFEQLQRIFAIGTSSASAVHVAEVENIRQPVLHTPYAFWLFVQEVAAKVWLKRNIPEFGRQDDDTSASSFLATSSSSSQGSQEADAKKKFFQDEVLPAIMGPDENRGEKQERDQLEGFLDSVRDDEEKRKPQWSVTAKSQRFGCSPGVVIHHFSPILACALQHMLSLTQTSTAGITVTPETAKKYPKLHEQIARELVLGQEPNPKAIGTTFPDSGFRPRNRDDNVFKAAADLLTGEEVVRMGWGADYPTTRILSVVGLANLWHPVLLPQKYFEDKRDPFEKIMEHWWSGIQVNTNNPDAEAIQVRMKQGALEKRGSLQKQAPQEAAHPQATTKIVEIGEALNSFHTYLLLGGAAKFFLRRPSAAQNGRQGSPSGATDARRQQASQIVSLNGHPQECSAGGGGPKAKAVFFPDDEQVGKALTHANLMSIREQHVNALHALTQLSSTKNLPRDFVSKNLAAADFLSAWTTANKDEQQSTKNSMSFALVKFFLFQVTAPAGRRSSASSFLSYNPAEEEESTWPITSRTWMSLPSFFSEGTGSATPPGLSSSSFLSTHHETRPPRGQPKSALLAMVKPVPSGSGPKRAPKAAAAAKPVEKPRGETGQSSNEAGIYFDILNTQSVGQLGYRDSLWRFGCIFSKDPHTLDSQRVTQVALLFMADFMTCFEGHPKKSGTEDNIHVAFADLVKTARHTDDSEEKSIHEFY
ncbi:unnamed protein product [Amoebophrya sp. A25]|nr:unnamed protein product [Amoebophrya sp. A25]|eukprot:GSA25T00019808001.1